MNSEIMLKCAYTPTVLAEAQKPLHKRAAMLNMILGILGLGVFVLGCFLQGGQLLVVFAGLLFSAYFFSGLNRAAKKAADRTVKAHLKKYGQAMKMELTFREDGFTGVSKPSEQQRELAYENVRRVVRTRNLLVLVMADSYAVIGDCRSVEETEITVLWEHLKAVCTEAKFEEVK